jgi:hypothetical protein
MGGSLAFFFAYWRFELRGRYFHTHCSHVSRILIPQFVKWVFEIIIKTSCVFIHQITGDEYQYVPPPQAAAAAAAAVQTAVSTPTAPAAVVVREKSQEIDRQMLSEFPFSAPPTSSTSLITITVSQTTGRVTKQFSVFNRKPSFVFPP